jgi:hypothetical protein
MTKLVLDPLLREKLRDVQEAELCDESGRTLGHYLSEEAYRRLVYQWANAQITDEELERRLQEPGGRSLAEIQADLEKS